MFTMVSTKTYKYEKQIIEILEPPKKKEDEVEKDDKKTN